MNNNISSLIAPTTPLRIRLRNLPFHQDPDDLFVILNSEVTEVDRWKINLCNHCISMDDGRMEISIVFNEIPPEIDEIADFCDQLRRRVSAVNIIINHNITVSVAICDASVFPQDFSLYHSLNLSAFIFGNFVDTENFLSHETINTTYRKPESQIMKEVNLLSEFSQMPQDTSILAEFEHDRKELSVAFPFIYEGVSSIITCSIRYEAIRDVIVYHSASEVQLFLHVRYPPKIKRSFKREGSNGWTLSRVTSWGNNIEKPRRRSNIAGCPWISMKIPIVNKHEICDLLGRLHKYAVTPVEFRTVTIRSRGRYLSFVEDKKLMELYGFDGDENFNLRYCLSALISRGAVVKDLILLDVQKRDDFLEEVRRAYIHDIPATIDILEQLLCQIDEAQTPSNLTQMFCEIKESGRVNAALQRTRNANWEAQGYVRVRKVIITPMRKLFVTPELMMGNRVLRKFEVNKFLRVIFRDEDGTRMSKMTGNLIMENCVKRVLKEGLRVLDKFYVMVGSSNSQLRDNGCYLVQGDIDEAVRIRKSMGRFKIEKVPKMMARIGQCFTQSKLSNIRLERNLYRTVPDFEGGVKGGGEPYCFSDGVGSISASCASRISQDLNCRDAVPSCFQFRFRGFKGVIAVNPALDLMNNFARKNDLKDLTFEVEFRQSQEKFIAPREEFIEIVKYSTPSPVCLNKPMINILDQISMKQSAETHRRISKHIQMLLNRHVNHIMASLNYEKYARVAISEFPQLIMVQYLYDFSLVQEPFFRSMLRAWSKSMLSKLLAKMKIQIPVHSGRTMFGIVDETGILQSGQVFIQYTCNAQERLPSPTAEKKILEGKVLLTKNPAVVSGDVRMYEAVDIPSLRHLVDVVVFPQSGPRPHPDEMAGSDLDGDEYTVIWDEGLFFDKNENAFDYSEGITPLVEDSDLVLDDDNDGDRLQSMMTDFFVQYITQDSIGQISNAHLANSDLYGIESQVCKNIAIKHNQSVDFPKTGIAPETLLRSWNLDYDLPPEKVQYFPDFMAKHGFLSYNSKKLLGILHRAVSSVQSIIGIAEFGVVENIEMDPALSFWNEEWVQWASKKEHQFVMKQRSSYVAQIQALMETYGIKSEGELFSGFYAEVKGKATDSGNNDDVSLFNMSTICQQRLEVIFSAFRHEFFKNFPDGELYLEATGSYQYQANPIISSICTRPTDEMIAVALLYYHIAYESGYFLSFAWLVWDILSVVKKKYNEFNQCLVEFDPLGMKLTDVIDTFMQTKSNVYESVIAKVASEIRTGSGIWRLISDYIQKHELFDKLLCYLACWHQQHKIEMELTNFFLFVILVGSGTLNVDVDVFEPFLYMQSELNADCPVNDAIKKKGLGRILIDLLACLSSNAFRNFEDFRVDTDEEIIFITKKECVCVHGAALRTFYQLSLTNSSTVLPSADHEAYSPVVEGHAMGICVPESKVNESLRILQKAAVKIFGCTYVSTRVSRKAIDNTTRITLVASGTMGSIISFYDALSVTPISAPTCREIYEDLTTQSWEKLQQWVKVLKD